MQIIPIVLLLVLLSSHTFGQHCPKYEKSIKAGDTYVRAKKYKEAIVEFQAAQIAARECDLSGDVLADKFKQVFDGLTRQKDEADANRVIAEKATALAREGLTREQKEKAKAEVLRDFARSQAYANAAYIFCEKDPTLAMSFAFSSLSIHKNDMAFIALLKAFNMNSWFYSHNWESFGDADLSPDGSFVARVSSEADLKIENLRTGRIVTCQEKADNVQFLPNGNILLWSRMGADKPLGDLIILTRDYKEICHYRLKFLNVTIDDKGTIMLPAFDEERRTQVCWINPDNGKLKKVLLPRSFTGLPHVNATSSQFTIFCEDFPASLWITTNSESGISINPPPRKIIRSVDIKGTKAVFYLRGAVKGEQDAIGVLNLDGLNSGRAMSILPLKDVNESDASGIVKFLDDNTIIASSTSGWSKILNLATNASYIIGGSRASDQIISFPKDSLFIMGRRSGEITVYDFKGIAISNLQGSIASDGLNEAFGKITIDKSGTQVLTVSRNGARLWQRPRYDLKWESLSSEADSVLPAKLSYFKLFDVSKGFDRASIEKYSLSSMPINNLGEIFLQFNLGGYTDLFKTNLQKGIENVFMMGDKYNFGYCLYTDNNYKRYFILKPDLVFGLIKKEFEEDRIMQITNKFKAKWVETDEFNRKVLNLNLEPIK